MKNFTFACRLVIPVFFSYVFIGLAYGILLHQAGYSVLWAVLSSMFIYAGSMQIVLVALLTSGASLWTIAFTALFINARHIFYGIGFVERFREIGGWKYPYMALTMTDETYSVLCSAEYPEDVESDTAVFYVQLLGHIIWVAASAFGALMGELIPFDMTGIEFSATAFFVTVVVSQWRRSNSHIPAITGFVSAIIFYFALGADNFILPALSVSAVVLALMKDRITLKTGGALNV
ncbi:MAG: AzlC family ABC transporter permease [Clostridiales bacterium]|jgi:4-azaleucine resistance transporter AzlC|nr:AzlC family ABC transporter permease [Clostridiales bacterium]